MIFNASNAVLLSVLIKIERLMDIVHVSFFYFHIEINKMECDLGSNLKVKTNLKPCEITLEDLYTSVE